MYQHILVPVDDSELAISLAAQAVAFAKRLGARITFFHARPDFAATSDGAVMHALSPAEFEQQAAGNACAVLARVEVEARMSGIAFDSLVRTSDRPYEAIVDVAAERACDLIFMASHGHRGVRGLLLGSQTAKVLAHARLPVLVATVESNAACPEMNAAIAAIKGEHRSIAAVMHALKHAIGEARGSGRAVEPALLRGVALYFRRFTAALHHPKEDSYLFERLRARSAEARALLDKLQQQHDEEAGYIDALDAAVDAYLHTPDGSRLAELARVADRYAERLWEHMSLEEKFVLPACQTQFEQADWAAIAHAFEANGDPRFDADRVHGFDRLFLKLVSLAH